MKNKILKTVNILATISIFIIVPVSLLVFVTSRDSTFFGVRSFVVATGSMQPKLPVGTMVFTIPSTNYNVGDIITFNRRNISITHRIYSIKSDKFITKGDANKRADTELVDKKNIIGKDILIVPFLGIFTNFLKTIPGFVVFLGIPTFIFIFLEGLNLKREWEKEIEKKILRKHNILEVFSNHELQT